MRAGGLNPFDWPPALLNFMGARLVEGQLVLSQLTKVRTLVPQPLYKSQGGQNGKEQEVH